MNSLRVLMLITNQGKGGAQRVFHDHAVAFSSFVTVEEVVYDLAQNERIYDTGLPLHELKRNDWWSCFGPVGRLISRAMALRDLVKFGNFNIVISHMDGANWVNVLSFSEARKVLVVHGTVLNDQNVRGLTQWLRINLIFPFLYNLADCTVAVSEGIARELREVGRVRNVQTIPNYFDIQSINEQALQPLPSEVDLLLKNNQVLITSGRLAEQKKQIYLLDIIAALRNRGNRAKLVILGDGELRDCLLQKCKELNLSTWHAWNTNSLFTDDFDVFFMGYVSNPYQYLKHASLFLFPSAWEGFPLALCEAMICGVAVVSTDCPTGPREILAPDSLRNNYELHRVEFATNGVLMPIIELTADIDLWVDTVQNLLLDADKRQNLCSNAKHAMHSLDWRLVLNKWQAMIKETADVDY